MTVNEKRMFERFADGYTFVADGVGGRIKKIEKMALCWDVTMMVFRPGRADLEKVVHVPFETAAVAESR